ncbi:hypothetical protein PR048_016051 [Dryococelus australis]|uniref:DUF4371 domain-containing protein n=1 Tax=Dryococelus australis TaxID=614101 RepID=A0ABQ9HIP7_9NEOP|nr:hypothetical protein PR048_016051 [Dryococelus australis]
MAPFCTLKSKFSPGRAPRPPPSLMGDKRHYCPLHHSSLPMKLQHASSLGRHWIIDRNIPLRGHSDYGEFDINTSPLENEGNFRALLREWVKSGNEKLRRHFESCGQNATYIGWNIQNQIVEACNDIITNKIVGEVNSAMFFSVLAEETTYISCSDQFALCLCYVKHNSNRGYSLQESFLQFLLLEATTGKNVADTLIRALQERGINYSSIRGQGYDGASMNGNIRGTQTYISEQYPKALYVHCSSHSLNIAISNSSEVTPIRNCFGTIRKLTGRDALSNAFILLNAIAQPDFIVALLSEEKLLSYTMPLSKKLQATDVDPVPALSYADYIVSVLTRTGENAETEFKISFRECEETARNIGSQITIPRLVKGRQVHTANVPADNAEEYFRRTVFIPWTNDLVSNLRGRFAKHKDILTSFVCRLSSVTSPSKESTENFIKLAEFYNTGLDSVWMKSLISEFELWYKKFQSPPKKNAIYALNDCDNSFFSNVHVLLKIFPSLRRIKNYLKNTMSDTRFKGLANLNIHREINTYRPRGSDNLVLKGPRRLNFVL